jgi:hypothetical protein
MMTYMVVDSIFCIDQVKYSWERPVLEVELRMYEGGVKAGRH